MCVCEVGEKNGAGERAAGLLGEAPWALLVAILL